MSPRHYIIPVFIPDLACPHQCVFCNQRNISGRMKIPDANEVCETAEKHLSTIPFGSSIEIGFFGGNFTGVEMKLQKELLFAAEKFVNSGNVTGIRISTRPDYINNKTLDLLKTFSVKTIELGAQSFNDDVLRLSGRGHDAETTIKASHLIKSHEFNLGLQMMVGLPGDNMENAVCTAKMIVKLGAENTRIYPVLVIKNTQLEKLYLEGTYYPLSLEEAILQVKEVYKILEDAGINILRVGLHPSEGLISKEVYIAGPFHVSFRELVLADLWKEKLSPLLNKKKQGDIVISVNPEQLNYAVGYNASNKKILQKHFRKVKFVCDNNLIGRNYHADHC